jgi:hypothetical protein
LWVQSFLAERQQASPICDASRYASPVAPLGTSWTEYRGTGFWCRDGLLEVWLATLVDTLDTRANWGGADGNNRWLKQLRDQWYDQATITGCDTSARLDDHVADEPRRRTLLALCHGARERIAFDVRPLKGSLAWRVGARVALWQREGSARRLLRMADSFIWLLDDALHDAPTGQTIWERYSHG